MILIDPVENVPAALDPSSAEVSDAWNALAGYYATTNPAGPPPGDPPGPLTHPEVVQALSEVFHGKCGYCETPLDAFSVANVDRFRPPRDAVGADGSVDPACYWWLSLAWDNLVLACHQCLRAKGSRFPVRGQRLGPGDPIDVEQPLLLDPRAGLQAPDSVLLFSRDGTVSSVDERGRATIDLLGLNRGGLVGARRAVVVEVIADHRAHPGLASNLHPGLSFLGLRRQLWAELTRDASLTSAPMAPDVRAATKVDYLNSQQAKLSSSLADDLHTVSNVARVDYFSATRWIERIEFRNVRPIRSIDLDLTRSCAATAPWMMLLGDNASGKSTMLQAVALTLVGAEYRQRLGVSPRSLLRRGARRGSVRIWLSSLPEPLVLEFNRDSDELTGTVTPQVMVLAYGATRLRSGPTSGEPRSDVSHIDNLFDSRHDLTDPNAWLLGLDDATFERIRDSLHRLLALESHQSIVRRPKAGQVEITHGRVRDPLPELSDGYQSMLVLACDVMRTMLSLWPTPEQAEGIVLIDEIGTHLHPRWRMRITSALRSVLPRVQFLVSTHDPLCLRGLEDGEITVINRNSAGEVVTLTDIPSIRGLRVDQLLTSDIFGLGSTEDPAVDALYQEYYTLRAIQRPGAAQQQRIASLEDELAGLRQLGVTERERMMLATADQLIAERRERGDAAVRPDLSSALADLWTGAGNA